MTSAGSSNQSVPQPLLWAAAGVAGGGPAAPMLCHVLLPCHILLHGSGTRGDGSGYVAGSSFQIQDVRLRQENQALDLLGCVSNTYVT